MRPFAHLALVASIFLTACQSDVTGKPSVVSDIHTGMVAKHSALFRAGASESAVVSATAVKEKELGYGVLISSHSSIWQFFKGAWSYGKQLRYTKLESKVDYCLPTCILSEGGFVWLSEKEFMTAAKIGLDLEIIGQRGGIDLRIPPEAFRQVIEAKP